MIHQFKPGDLFNNRYRLEKLVGVGGFADVWKARDILINTTVALKIYTRLDDDGINELSEEYRRMQNINHPNLLRADYFDSWDNIPYLVMKFCSGGSLDKKVGKLTDIEIISIIRDLCEGLKCLHQSGVIHQDIKPANILIDEQGHYVLSDFGISSKSKSTLRKSVNMFQNTSMTEDYAPPEKFSPKAADRMPDKKGDIFSLGISLYELITGNLPFDNLSTGRQLQYENIRLDYSEIKDTKIRGIVQWCMQREKDKRPSASEIVSFLNNHKHAPNLHKEKKRTYIWIIVLIALIVGGYGTGFIIKKIKQRVSTPDGIYHGHGYVDLGLSSGTLWATCNVGADSPTEPGDYFAWGETTTKSYYTENNSKTYGKQYTDYAMQAKQRDAARSNWDGIWRMPTGYELQELVNECTWIWMSRYAKSDGYKVIGPNGKSIFIPAAGLISSEKDGMRENVCYWSSTPDSDKTAFCLFRGFNHVEGISDTASLNRYYGMSVRPVLSRDLIYK